MSEACSVQRKDGALRICGAAVWRYKDVVMCESVFKVLIIGDQYVGKTSMIARYCLNKWLASYKATIGADYAVKSIKWSPTETVRLHLWDIAGQESFRAMTRTYFRGASGCVVMFDVTNRNTFEHTRDWKADLDSKVVLPNGEPIPCILMANKDDLPNKLVASQEIEAYAKENGYFHWVPISVKEDKNVTEAMQCVNKSLASFPASHTPSLSHPQPLTLPAFITCSRNASFLSYTTITAGSVTMSDGNWEHEKLGMRPLNAIYELVKQMLQQEYESGVIQQAEDRNMVRLDKPNNGTGGGCCAR